MFCHDFDEKNTFQFEFIRRVFSTGLIQTPRSSFYRNKINIKVTKNENIECANTREKH